MSVNKHQTNNNYAVNFFLPSLNLLILHQDLVLAYLKIQNKNLHPQQNKIKSKKNAIIANT